MYAVVKGTAVNNDGRVKIGYTAPSVDGQSAVIRMALDAAEVDPATIAYVETHGTATALGDQIELQALTEAFGSHATRAGSCALGALKALIGHLDAAAGVAGFIKACLALHHGVIPPSPYFVAPHPALELGAGPFFVNAEPRAWPPGDDPPRAAVSSFGIGGTNAHAVLEAAPATAPAPSQRTAHLLVLSARTAEALGAMRDRLAAALREGDGTSLGDVAYTLQTTRRTFAHRLTVVCRDRAEAAAALAAEASADVRAAVEERTDGTVAFLFPGQGAQHPQMAAGLYRSERGFREPFDACAAILAVHGVDLAAVFYPDGDPDAAAARLRQTAFTQPALFAVEYALAHLWAEWGVRPAAMAGHSIGEYVAACLAGVFELEDALAAVVARGRLMEQAPPGAMLAVHLPAAELEPLLPDGVSLAAANAPRLSVAAGDTAAVSALAARLRERQVGCRELHTSHAFHSPAMDAVLEPFAERLRSVALRPPRIPIASTVTGRWLTEAEATDPAYWARQLRQPVQFDAGAGLLLESGHDLLEVGPGTSLATLARQQDAARGRTVVSSLGHPGRPQPDGAAMADALGRLWLAGVGIDWQGVWAGEQRRRLPLPTYPFQRTRHWVDAPGAAGRQRCAGANGCDRRRCRDQPGTRARDRGGGDPAHLGRPARRARHRRPRQLLRARRSLAAGHEGRRTHPRRPAGRARAERRLRVADDRRAGRGGRGGGRRPSRRRAGRRRDAGAARRDPRHVTRGAASAARGGANMTPDTYRVVVNDEEQYSIWPEHAPAAPGWRDGGFAGTRGACVAHVETVWTDLRPRSVREHLAAVDCGDARLGPRRQQRRGVELHHRAQPPGDDGKRGRVAVSGVERIQAHVAGLEGHGADCDQRGRAQRRGHPDLVGRYPQPVTRGLEDRLLARPGRREPPCAPVRRQRLQIRHLAGRQDAPAQGADLQRGVDGLDVDADGRRASDRHDDPAAGVRDRARQLGRVPRHGLAMRTFAVRAGAVDANRTRRRPGGTAEDYPQKRAPDREAVAIRRSTQPLKPVALAGIEQARMPGAA